MSPPPSPSRGALGIRTVRRNVTRTVEDSLSAEAHSDCSHGRKQPRLRCRGRRAKLICSGSTVDRAVVRPEEFKRIEVARQGASGYTQGVRLRVRRNPPVR